MSFENHINDGNLWLMFNMNFEKYNWKKLDLILSLV
jgi:hypothetical protein